MYGKSNMDEAELYYLFMMSDGEVSDSEEILFKNICKELKLVKSEIEEVVHNCKQVSPKNKGILKLIKQEKINQKGSEDWYRMRRKNKSSRARIVWNLVNLGYADGVYSQEEKGIVSYLTKEWDVEKVVYSEMIDVADTMLALTKQKEWVASTFPEGTERNKKEKEIDKEISQMISDIKLTISELTM